MTLSRAAQEERTRQRQEATAQAAAAAEATETEEETTEPEAEAEPTSTLEPEPQPDVDAPSGAPVDLAALASEEGAPAGGGKDLSEFVILNGPASYGPIKVNGEFMRLIAGKAVRIVNVEERLALLGLPGFRLATPDDFKPPYSGPITTAQIHGGGLRDPEQI